MPQSVLDLTRVYSLLPHAVSERSFEELLFASKAEIGGREGESVTLEVTPDRLDLLSEGGLALYLQGVLGSATGLPPIREHPPRSLPVQEIEVDPSVGTRRPVIAGIVVEAPSEAGIDEGTLNEAVRFQEILHATVGFDRRLASLGIYPLERLSGRIRYALEPLDAVRFVPLDASEEVVARPFFQDHPMAQRYGDLGRVGDQCLTLRDSAGTILSLPPILNSRTGGEARVGDRRLLLESTGTRVSRVMESLGLLLMVFAARGYSASPVTIRHAEGSNDGIALLRPRTMSLPRSLVEKVGGHTVASADVEPLLRQARLGVHAEAGGWAVEIPPWRPDLLAPIDLVEDVLIARGIRPEDGLGLPSATRGRRRPETIFRRRISTLLLGQGFSPLYTTVLVPSESIERLDRKGAIRIANPPSELYAFLRDALQVSLLDALGRNTRHGYPQRLAEVGPIVALSPAAESGAETRYHAGTLIAGEGSGFAEVASLLDYLLRSLDVIAIREPAELPGTIPGRAARLRIAGEPVGELGEVHPRVLSALKVPVPVAWGELDLSALWPLLRRRATD